MKTIKTSFQKAFQYIGYIFGEELHAKRLESLANAVGATLGAESLAIAAIGRALSAARGIKSKHGIKQIDRLLSNNGVDLRRFLPLWVRFLLAARTEIVVALDWTDFDKDNHVTLAIHLITRHGRASALVWKTFDKTQLKQHRNDYEDELLCLFKECLPEKIKVTLLADRGFGDTKLYAFLRELGFDFIIRFRANTLVQDSSKERKKAQEWLTPNGLAKRFLEVEMTQEGYCVPAFICVREKKMKEAWFLACSDPSLSASAAVKLYGRRFTIEESFRDMKNLRLGMGLSDVRIASQVRRDRLLLVCVIATSLLTLLGAAGEAIGLDRGMKANTVRTRTHSLFSQGCHYYACIPNMREDDLRNLLEQYKKLLQEQRVFTELFGDI